MGKTRNTSGNPAIRAAAAKARAEANETPLPPVDPSQRSTAANWKSKAKTADDARDLLLPSGNVALVKRIAPEAFLASGMIPDAMQPILEKSIRSKQGLPPEIEQDMLADPKMLKSIIELMDAAIVAAVVEPRVILAVPEGQEQPDDCILASDVEFEDKAFIFNYALGGSKDLARFRGESDNVVARLSTGIDVPLPAK
jgi:hypothetical protein